MYLKLERIIKTIMTVSLLLITMLTSLTYAESDIAKNINKLSKKDNLTINSFKELVNDYNNNGYTVYVLDLQEGYTIPKLITDESINEVKETCSSIENLTEENYPNIFKNFEVEFLKSQNGKEFVFLLESNLVKVIIQTKGDAIQASINGNNLVNISEGEEIYLQRGKTYTLNVYKNGNEIYSKDIDLTNYDLDEYKIQSTNYLVWIILLLILSIIGFIFIKNILKKGSSKSVIKKIKPITEPELDNDSIGLPNKIESISKLLKNNEYEDVLDVEIIDKLKDHIHSTDSRLRLVKNNNQNILKNIDINDYNKKIVISEILDESDEVNEDLQKIKDDVHKLELLIKDIQKYDEDQKIREIKRVVEKSKNIFIKLQKCYLSLDDIKSRQYYIEAYDISSNKLANNSIYTKESYIDIVDNNTKILKNLVEYIIKRDKDMKDFTQFISEEMISINDSIKNVYSEMKSEVNIISDSLKENSLNMNIAMKELDANVIKILNKSINDIRKQISDIEKSSNHKKSLGINLNKLKENLKEDIEKAINMKLDVIEELIPIIVENIKNKNININNMPILKKYKGILDKTSFEYLRTAEYLYSEQIENKKIKLEDYSNIYIMYSKLLEYELFKCLDKSIQNKNKYLSLGKILDYLLKYNRDIWSDFNNSLKMKDIQSLRNHAAHKSDSTIKISHVNCIRNLLFEISKENNNECWLDFIIKKQ